MCRHASRELPPEPRSASVARAFLRDCFTDWDLMELYDDTALALTELVANAVMHAATPLVVAVSCEGGMVEMAVHDGNPSMPAIRPHRTDIESDIRQALAAESAAVEPMDERDPRVYVGDAGSLAGGRGLLIVDALSAQWGVSPLSDGKAVWVRTPVPKGWPHAADCSCAHEEQSTVLGSGRTVVHRG
ncbi:MAG TPA: ATP-binding protein [Acidothermaceae bacterium]